MKYLIQGNFHTFNVTLTQNDGTTTTPFIPTENDKILINLNTANKQFQYKDFSQSQNVLTFTDNGCLSVGVYQLEVKIIDRSSHKLRCMYRDQLMVVASNDDIPLAESFDIDDINLGAEISISPQIVVDDELSLTSENPVQNKVVTAALDRKVGYLYCYEDTETGFDKLVIRIFGQSDEGHTDVTECVLGCVGDGGANSEFSSVGLMRIEDKNKLDGIEAQANKTVVDSSLSSSSENPVQNKVITQKLKTKYDGFYRDILSDAIDFYFMADGEYVANWYIESATTTGAGLMSAADKTKLGGIEVQANKTVVDSSLSSSSENPVQNKVITQKLKTKYDGFYRDILSDAIDFYFMADGEYVGNWYIESATTSTAGVMSAADKTKLNGIEAQANKTVVDNSFDTTSTNPISNSAVALALGDIETILDNILGN